MLFRRISGATSIKYQTCQPVDVHLSDTLLRVLVMTHPAEITMFHHYFTASKSEVHQTDWKRMVKTYLQGVLQLEYGHIILSLMIFLLLYSVSYGDPRRQLDLANQFLLGWHPRCIGYKLCDKQAPRYPEKGNKAGLADAIPTCPYFHRFSKHTSPFLPTKDTSIREQGLTFVTLSDTKAMFTGRIAFQHTRYLRGCFSFIEPVEYEN